ncbi:hypothetical protein [Synechocystis sp. PCC 6714]|nr:transposase [Synechocystis sp. CS-94]
MDPRGTSQQCPDCGARVSNNFSAKIRHYPDFSSVKPGILPLLK